LKNIFFASTIIASGVFFPFYQANAHGAKTITSPYVSEGETELELKAGYILEADDHEDGYGGEVAVSHGVTSYWQVEVGLSFEDEGRGHDLEAKSLNLESKFQLAQPGEYFVDPGIKLEYAHSLNGGSDKIGAKFVLAKEIEKFSNVANFEISKEIGDDADSNPGYGFAYGVSYALQENLALGAEWHSDFGNFDKDFNDQDHQIGPVVYGDAFGVEYEVGLLAGVSKHAPDAELKFVVGYEF
jgi:hypothetical protein